MMTIFFCIFIYYLFRNFHVILFRILADRLIERQCNDDEWMVGEKYATITYWRVHCAYQPGRATSKSIHNTVHTIHSVRHTVLQYYIYSVAIISTPPELVMNAVV